MVGSYRCLKENLDQMRIRWARYERVTGWPESAGINRHVGVSKEGWRIQ